MSTVDTEVASAWIKEQRVFARAILKYLPAPLLGIEAWGYDVAARASVPTATLFGRLPDCLVLEELAGLTCHRAIDLLRERDTSSCVALLDVLWQDQERLQEQLQKDWPVASSELSFAPYAVEEKLAAVSQLMPDADLRTLLARSAASLAEQFRVIATIPFRDANPKNCMLAGVHDASIAVASVESRRHFDFRSLEELTTPADDYLSIILHPVVPEEYRKAKTRLLTASLGVEMVTLTSVVRLARLWGRRQYYLLHRPDLYQTRYALEPRAIEQLWRLFAQSLHDAIDLRMIT